MCGILNASHLTFLSESALWTTIGGAILGGGTEALTEILQGKCLSASKIIISTLTGAAAGSLGLVADFIPGSQFGNQVISGLIGIDVGTVGSVINSSISD